MQTVMRPLPLHDMGQAVSASLRLGWVRSAASFSVFGLIERFLASDLRQESPFGPHSASGPGTAFASDPAMGSHPVRAIEGQPGRVRRRVLVVDDDPHSRQAVARLLEVEGYDAKVAADGEEGAALLGSWQPHLVLTDLSMPRLDGRGLLQRVRRESPGTPVIVLTARPTAEGQASLLELGAAGFFSKPVEVDELLARIRGLID